MGCGRCAAARKASVIATEDFNTRETQAFALPSPAKRPIWQRAQQIRASVGLFALHEWKHPLAVFVGRFTYACKGKIYRSHSLYEIAVLAGKLSCYGPISYNGKEALQQ